MLLFFSLLIMSTLSQNTNECKWNYDNPHSWVNLNCVHSCGGASQSPVDIAGHVVDNSLGPLVLEGYDDFVGTLDVVWEGVEVIASENYTGTLNGNFKLKNFHMHTQAEETINGVGYNISIHFVHASPNELAVIGLLFKIGEPNAFLQQVIDLLPENRNISLPINIIGLNTFLNNLATSTQYGYWTYVGSLTVPPCTEGVKWFVMQEILTCSLEQFNALHILNGNNYRPIQRTLTSVSAYIPQVPQSPEVVEQPQTASPELHTQPQATSPEVVEPPQTASPELHQPTTGHGPTPEVPVDPKPVWADESNKIMNLSVEVYVILALILIPLWTLVIMAGCGLYTLRRNTLKLM